MSSAAGHGFSAGSPADTPSRGGLAFQPGASVEVRVSELIVGRRLKSPLEDSQGVLLLGRGAAITERFKELLLVRGVQQVMLHEDDAATCAAVPEVPRVRERIDEKTAERLNQLIDSGRLFAADAGPQFRERIVLHGCTGYNREQRARLVEQHASNCGALDSMMKLAGQGRTLEAGQIATLVTNYLKHLVADVDCAVDVLNQGRSYIDLADECLQMSLLGMALAIEMGMGEGDVRMTGLAGLLHDWGMTRVPDAIRNANRPLTRVEFLAIEKHPTYTIELLQRISGIPAIVALICFQVHEQPNGKGYPRRRQHAAIHPCARVLNVVDAYLSLFSPRWNRGPLTPRAAMISLLRSAKDNSVDPAGVRCLLKLLSLYPIGSRVLLSDGRAACVIRRNGNNYDAPIVQIVQHAGGEPVVSEDSGEVVDPLAAGVTIVQEVPASGSGEIGSGPEAASVAGA